MKGSLVRSTSAALRCACASLAPALAFQAAIITLHAQSPVIYSFAGGAGDGANPKRGVIVSGSSLYSVTPLGGSSSDGTVYEMTYSSGSWSETVLYSFAGGTSDGSEPDGSLVLSGGNLYGTTSVGGASGYGTVFKLKNTSGTWTESVLHNFAGGAGDGSLPYAGLLLSGGVFYGTTYYGGTYGKGTVLSLTPSAPRGPKPSFIILAALATEPTPTRPSPFRAESSMEPPTTAEPQATAQSSPLLTQGAPGQRPSCTASAVATA